MPEIQIWEPRGNSGLTPLEAMPVHYDGDGKPITYRTRPVGSFDWRMNMSAKVLEMYYQRTDELQEAA